MTLTRGQAQVLDAIIGLWRENPGVPVTISAIHHTFTDLDVSDLVLHLGTLLDRGLIANARPTTERIGNTFVVTAGGMEFYQGSTGKN
jgi:hypothetical protein